MDDFEKRLVNFGRYINSLRETRGWSISDLSDKSGIPQSTLKRIEKGNLIRLKLSHLAQLAFAFKLKISKISDAFY